MDILPGLILGFVIAAVVVRFVVRWLDSVAAVDVGTPTRMGMTKCTTCWKWSRSRRFELASVTQDETLGTEAVVTDRVCPECGDLVRFPPTDEGSWLVVALKRRLGLRCPNCGKLDWKSAFDDHRVSNVRGGLLSGTVTRNLERSHESCGFSWKVTQTYETNPGSGG
jgi:hypothetical protein